MRGPLDAVTPVAGVVLAAGRSERFGGAKLLAPLDGKPLLQHAIDAANGSELDDVIVVLGHAAAPIAAAVRLGRARVVVNADHAAGQSTSLKAGLRAAAASNAVIVLLGDQPRVTSLLINKLLARGRATGAPAVMSCWNGRRSAPTLLRRELWPDLERIGGDVGARDVIAARGDVAVLEVTEAMGSLDDVDRPDDLQRLTHAPEQS